MKTNILVDSNILVYAYDMNSSFHDRAVALLSNPSFKFHIGTKNITEFFAVLSKMKAPFDKIFIFYSDTVRNSTILFPDTTSLLIFERLMQKYQPRGNRVFDMEIVSIAIANGIQEIHTFNVKDFEGVTEITVVSL